MRALTDEEANDLRKGICPYCTNTSFTIGPTGGGSENIECKEVRCGARFNLAYPARSELIRPPLFLPWDEFFEPKTPEEEFDNSALHKYLSGEKIK